MIIETGIQANCSEATMRILLDGHPQKSIDKLYEKLQIECDEYFEKEKSQWDDEENKQEFSWYETSAYIETIFGKKVLTIKGDAPYNSSDDCYKLIDRYLKKAKVEVTE